MGSGVGSEPTSLPSVAGSQKIHSNRESICVVLVSFSLGVHVEGAVGGSHCVPQADLQLTGSSHLPSSVPKIAGTTSTTVPCLHQY